MIRPGIRRLVDLAVRRRDRVARDVHDEVRLHLDLRAAQLERDGWSPEAARAEAERRFGSLEHGRRALEQSASRRERRLGTREWIESVLQDLRYAARGLRRSPAFTVFAATTLALGIGANVAMYGVVDRLLLRGPEHVRAPDRLVRFLVTTTDRSGQFSTSSGTGYVMYDHLRAATHDFVGIAGYTRSHDAALGEGRSTRTIRAAYASAGFFPLLGVTAARGRFFGDDEDDVANPRHVVILGDVLWRVQFGSDPDVIGKTVRIGDEPFTVIGVAPRGFTGVDLQRVDAWMPMTLLSMGVRPDWQTTWKAQWMRLIGRLRPGVARSAASGDATTAHQTTAAGAPPDLRDARITVVPIRFTDAGRETAEAAVSRWLMGVTLAVLLIACANVANLLLARATRRRAEVGLRLALGAARGRLVRLFLTESLLLALGSGVLALAVAAGLTAFIRGALLPQVEWTASVVSGRMFLVGLGTALLVGVIAGTAPAAHGLRVSLARAMRSGPLGRGGRLALGDLPAVFQALLAVSLLVGAGLFLRSFERAQSVHLGFDADRVLRVTPAWTPDAAGAGTSFAARRARRRAVLGRALTRIRELPGVEDAALAVGSPFGYQFGVDLFVTGLDTIPALPGGGPFISAVSSDYFRTVGTRVLRGRSFAPGEGPSTERVVIVNQTMARTLWPGRDAIGECLRIEAATMPCSRVVGIVEDAHRNGLEELPAMQYYIPFGQETQFGGTVVLVRSARAPQALATPVENVLLATDAMVSHVRVAVMQEAIDPLLRPWRLGASVFTLGGVLALLVASLGLYSVLSYMVAQRRRELGVRIALGASGLDIVRLVVGRSLGIAAGGIALGVAVSLPASRLLDHLLFRTSARDPWVFLVASLALLGAAALAGAGPALRARRVDPVRALNAE